MLARQIMKRVATLNSQNCSMRDLLSYSECGAVVLEYNGEPVGVAMKEWLLNFNSESWNDSVANLMTKEFQIIRSDAPLAEDAPIIETIV